MGTKSDDGHASPGSSDTVTSLGPMVTSSSTSRPTCHHPTPSTGRKPWRGMAAAVETPLDICFSGTIKETTDGVETPEENTRRNVVKDRQLEPVSSKRIQQQHGRERERAIRENPGPRQELESTPPPQWRPQEGQRHRRRRHHWLQKTRARFSPEGEGQNYSHRVGSLHYRCLQEGNRRQRASPSTAQTGRAWLSPKLPKPLDHSLST
jgi:hypothetical protein